jgi:YhcH/YjgK/YiaL family protein
MSGIEDAAIFFDTYYEDVPAGKERNEVRTVLRDKTPEFRDFYISDIYCRGAGTAISITGLPEMPVHDIHFSNMVIAAQKGYEATNANNMEQKNVKIILSSGNDDKTSAAPWNGISIKPHTSINTSELEKQYRIYPRLWDTAFAFLNSRDLGSLAPGKYPLIGDSVFVSVTLGPGKEFENTNWESHRNYIDIQYVAAGKESIGVMPVKSAVVTKPYDAAKDAANYSGEGSFFTAEPGVFFIFFPSDAHRPGIKVEEGDVRKVVVKVMVREKS